MWPWVSRAWPGLASCCKHHPHRPGTGWAEGEVWQEGQEQLNQVNFYHKTRLLVKFGVKKTTMMDWVGAQPLFLAYFGIDSKCEPTRALFTHKTPPVHICYVANWYWMLKSRFQGVASWPILAPLLLIFIKGNDPISTSHQPLGLFTQFLLQWCFFLTRIPKHQWACNLVQWVIWCGHLTVKSRGSRHGPLRMVSVTGTFQTQVLWKACKQVCHFVPSLKGAHHGDHTLGSCQNHTHLGPHNPLW